MGWTLKEEIFRTLKGILLEVSYQACKLWILEACMRGRMFAFKACKLWKYELCLFNNQYARQAPHRVESLNQLVSSIKFIIDQNVLPYTLLAYLRAISNLVIIEKQETILSSHPVNTTRKFLRTNVQIVWQNSWGWPGKNYMEQDQTYQFGFILNNTILFFYNY